MAYRHMHTITHKNKLVTLALIDAPHAKLETPIRQRYRVLNERDNPIGYVETATYGGWAARNRTEASNGDTVRYSAYTNLDDALRCLLGWHEEDLHIAEGPADEPDPLAPAGGQVIPDPRVAVEPTPTGIALRDWFAGQALRTALRIAEQTGQEPASKRAAQWAYEIADAMLAERDCRAQNKSSQKA